MTAYTVEFQYRSELVEAADTDMAVIAAREASDLSSEDLGELMTVTLHADGQPDLTLKSAFAQEREPMTPGESMTPPAKPLPARRIGGLSLSYDGGDLFVTCFGYSSSLLAAHHEGVLNHSKGFDRFMELNDRQQRIVDEWMDCEADYYEVNGWATWAEVNES